MKASPECLSLEKLNFDVDSDTVCQDVDCFVRDLPSRFIQPQLSEVLGIFLQNSAN